MRRMYETGSDIYFTSTSWKSNSIDLVNSSVGLQTVGSQDIQWSNGASKFFHQGNGKRFSGGMNVQPYLTGQGASAAWKEIKKADFDTFPAAGAKVNVILDFSTDDVILIPEDTIHINSDSRDSTLIVLNKGANDAAAFHTVNYANRVQTTIGFDSIGFRNQIKDWYRAKGWLEETEDPDGTISAIVTIPSQYVTITATGAEVKGEALPPSAAIYYAPDEFDQIYILPRAIVTVK